MQGPERPARPLLSLASQDRLVNLTLKKETLFFFAPFPYNRRKLCVGLPQVSVLTRSLTFRLHFSRD